MLYTNGTEFSDIATVIHLGIKRIAMAAIAFGAAFMPASAQAPELAMLDTLNRGGWIVRERGANSDERICLRTGRELIQLSHGQAQCDRFVLQDDAEEVTVQYRCRGNGYGRTTIRRESNGLVQIQSNGFSGGKPFSVAAEARYVGKC